MKISTLFATKRARVIAITVAAVVLVLAILTPILLYVGGYIMPFDADGQPSERLLRRIEEDYGKAHVDPSYTSDRDDVSVKVCYGVYNGTVIITYSCRCCRNPTWSKQYEIGEEVFIAGSREMPVAWREGEIISLRKAYDQGWLNAGDLRAIAKKYNDYWDVDWENYDGSFYQPGY